MDVCMVLREVMGFLYYFKDNNRTDLSILLTVLSCRISDLLLRFYI